MGTAESSQSPDLGGIGGFNGPSVFRRQSPNVARLIHGENSQKMEYEFPISDVNPSNLGHHRHHQNSGGTSNHTLVSGQKNHPTPHQQIILNENLSSNRKMTTTETSSLWSSLTNCFTCRTRDGNSSPMSPLRDKVHAIRIVRASNDLTPAVFDSQYNIITLEQLRECDNNGTGNLSDSSDLTNLDNVQSAHNSNGSVSAAASSSSKKTSNRRMKKKKKKRAAAAGYTVKTVTSDDDEEHHRRT